MRASWQTEGKMVRGHAPHRLWSGGCAARVPLTPRIRGDYKNARSFLASPMPNVPPTPRPAPPLLLRARRCLRLEEACRSGDGGLGFRGRAIGFGELAAAVDDLQRWLVRHGAGAGRTVGGMAGKQAGGMVGRYS